MTERPDDQLTELARACRILEMEGHGDFTLGHAALRDPGGRGIWMKRNAHGLGEIRGPDDFVLVSWTGEKLAGEGGRHSEWPIHSEIMRARADVAVTFHTHPTHACVVSGAKAKLVPYTLSADYFLDVPRHDAEVALIRLVSEGEDLARALGPHKAMFLANHGVVFCGASVAEATCMGVFLEQACRAHLLGAAAGIETPGLSRAIRDKRHSEIMSPSHIEQTFAYLGRKLEKVAGSNVLYR